MQCYSFATSSTITPSSIITPSSSIISRSSIISLSSITTSIIISATTIIITRRRSLPWSSLSWRRSIPRGRSLPLWRMSSRMINCLIFRFAPNYILSFHIAIYNLLLPSFSLNMILLKIRLYFISVYIEIILNLIMILFIWPFLK